MTTVVIGVRDSVRELTIDIDLSPEALFGHVEQCLTQGAPITLTDTRGDRVLIPANALGFIQVATDKPQRVGFAIG